MDVLPPCEVNQFRVRTAGQLDFLDGGLVRAGRAEENRAGVQKIAGVRQADLGLVRAECDLASAYLRAVNLKARLNGNQQICYFRTGYPCILLNYLQIFVIGKP